MKLKKARIYRFKTIQEDTFNLSDLTALVGENNSGKSNILDALDVFFSPEKYENEFEKYIKGHRRGSFIIDCFFARNSSWPSNFRKNLDADDLLRIRFQYNSTEQSYNHYEFKNGNLSQPVVLDNSKKEWLFNHIAFLKITAIRDIDKEINSSDSSLISLVKHLYEKKYSDRDILKNQLENVGKYAERKILSNLVEIWSDKLQIGVHEFEIELELKPDVYDFLGQLEATVQEQNINRNLRPKDLGSGYQGQLFIAIIWSLMDSIFDNFILALEEPEANLHPQSQRRKIEALKSICDSENQQIILTTHSRDIVNELSLRKIIVVRKHTNEDRNTETFQISKCFFHENNISEEQFMDKIDEKSSEFFFARGVIIVEGKYDKIVFKELCKKYSSPVKEVCDVLDLDALGISLLEFGGGDGIKILFKGLNKLGIEPFVIIDRDKIQNPVFEKEEEKELVVDNLARKIFKVKFGGFLEELNFSASNTSKLKSEMHKGRTIKTISGIKYKKGNIKGINEILSSKNVYSMEYDLEYALITRGNLDVIKNNCRALRNKTYKDAIRNKKQIKNRTVIRRIARDLRKVSFRQNLSKLLNRIEDYVESIY